MAKITLDDVDLKIIKFLLQDSMAPVTKIAGYLGLHPSAITYRVRKLKESGVIKKFTVSIDWRKLGKEVEAALLISCSPKNFAAVTSTLANMEEVRELHTISVSQTFSQWSHLPTWLSTGIL